MENVAVNLHLYCLIINYVDEIKKCSKLIFSNYSNPKIAVKNIDMYYNEKSSFNQQLGNSLEKLTNLQQLTFGFNFNRPLKNSLEKLINLQQLTLGYCFNQILENTLEKLTSLTYLKLSKNLIK